MKLLSTRARAELWKLQGALRKSAEERNSVFRHLLVSRRVLTDSAQRDLWLEFSWVDQEYRFCVMQLSNFCAKHGPRANSP